MPSPLRKNCPNREQHTDPPGPYIGYVEWFEWAEKMAETHEQKRCPGCGLFALWEPKTKAVQDAA